MASFLFHSLGPLDNPLGFGASDFVELAFALALAAMALLWRPYLAPSLGALSHRAGWSMLLLAALPVALRLALVPHYPAPTPDIYDEFGHLFAADTLRHWRLANPRHPLHQFFETFFVLQEPTYSSIYPIGQGLALAIGRAIFGHPWAGVIASTAAFCSLCYWMLRAWTTAEWALAGGFLAILEFGPLNQWMNNYWGGSLAAAAGCLVFGALPRWRERGRLRDALLVGIGLGVNLLTRPYESIFLGIAALLYFLPALRKPAELRPLVRTVPAIVLMVGIAGFLTALQNQRVTGHWTTLPYTLSQYQYGVPAALTFQADPVPHRELTPQQQREYELQKSFRGGDRETIESYLLRLEYRVRFYRFYFVVPLLAGLPFFFLALREFRYGWVAATALLFALGTNFFPAFQFHYLAAITPLFVLMSVVALEQLSRFSREASRLLLLLCVAYFGFWYTMHIFAGRDFAQSILRYETWDGLNLPVLESRIVVNRELAQIPGKLLVFVRYSPQHIFQDEWVYNEADIDAARIVWARDLGPEENQKLRRYYPDRVVLLLDPDSQPPRLTSYPAP
ncbi:MAG TPA: hypothetical protein VK419_07460 [Bryobacteraceae bacterium]|nr:hypothetical protein [Bryobacteraceae bacterium]